MDMHQLPSILRTLAEAVELYNSKQSAPPAPPVSTAPASTPAEPEVKLTDLQVLASELIKSGNREALIQLLSHEGVKNLSSLPKESYVSFKAKLIEVSPKA